MIFYQVFGKNKLDNHILLLEAIRGVEIELECKAEDKLGNKLVATTVSIDSRAKVCKLRCLCFGTSRQ